MQWRVAACELRDSLRRCERFALEKPAACRAIHGIRTAKLEAQAHQFREWQVGGNLNEGELNGTHQDAFACDGKRKAFGKKAARMMAKGAIAWPRCLRERVHGRAKLVCETLQKTIALV